MQTRSVQHIQRPLNHFGHKMGEKLTRIFFSSASLLAGILVAVLIQAVLSSLWDNF